MRFGVYMFPADYAIPPDELARAVEARGLHGLYFPEHTHIPSSRLSPFPFAPELPKEYSHTLDPFVAMAAAAAVTKTLRLGTSICLVVERDPITTAKEVASVDHLSGGRVDFGIGGGWNKEEMENHGTDFSRRWKVLRERTEAMQAIWTHDVASYHGEFVNFDKIWSWPKPVQKPYPPVLMGGDGPRTLQRIVRYADGWMPFPQSAAELSGKMRTLASMAKEAGRGPLPTHLFAAKADADELRRLEDIEVYQSIFYLPPGPAEAILPRLDKLAQVVRRAA
ncbi:MAG: LLM class F420-dependent oxidoreductase [Candidatus Lambdaproteobacteria bacterium]|nr:LLM class F420-dependent oxidoreductase [Candidatus Lambdaproteobacteria bacterium]